MISSNQRRIAAARSFAVFARQPGSACCAASIARCVSVPLQFATLAISMPSAGLSTAKRERDVPGSQAPPM